MKIAVYAIAKDESAFVDRWYESMKEADAVYVLDTGSTDGTAERLSELGASVTRREYEEFRFDVARNDSLALVPEDFDICVCTDLDEVWHEPGWRKKVEDQWAERMKTSPGLVVGTYDYARSIAPDGTVTSSFSNFKIHARKGASWKYACHEILAYSVPVVSMHFEGIRLDHHQDQSRSRAGYLPLLEKSAEENPGDARPLHYLGREYMYAGRYDDAIAAFAKQLEVKDGWNGERAQAMRFAARCHAAKGDFALAISSALCGMAEDPRQRECAVDLASIALESGRPELAVMACRAALRVKTRTDLYLTDARNWGSFPYHLLSVALSRCRPDTMDPAARKRETAVAVSLALQRDMYDENIWRNTVKGCGQSPVYPPIRAAREILDGRKEGGGKLPDWGMFDRIVCLHYVGFQNRIVHLAEELRRVGLLDFPGFRLEETVRTSYEDRLPGENPGIKNLALNTLRVLKLAKAGGCRRMLVMEDDVRFLKDTDLMAEIFASSPDTDVVVYDKMSFVFPPKMDTLCSERRINRHFVGWDHGIFSGSCYSLNAKAIDRLVGIYESSLIAPDEALQCDGLTKSFSIVNTSCQEYVSGGLSHERFGSLNTKNGYAFQGLDYGMYNVSDGYGYDRPVTEDDLSKGHWPT